jgi:ferredoxin
VETAVSTKYHIETNEAPPRRPLVGRYSVIENREDCAGSCRECVKDRCIYLVHQRNYRHVSTMKDAEFLYECQSCLRCIQECTRGIFSLSVNPEYLAMGDAYWKPEIIETTWYQAEKGSIPVSGAGYRGPYSGPGFDSMWTDMSEIVRPTRDGIHGREYINTTVQLSRRPERLRFNGDMTLAADLPPVVEIPLPVLFQLPEMAHVNDSVRLAAARAVNEMDTFMLLKPEEYTESLEPYAASLAPCLEAADCRRYADLISRSRLVELAWGTEIENAITRLREDYPELVIAVGLPLDSRTAEKCLELSWLGIDTIHIYADRQGNEPGAERPRYLADMIGEIHNMLVDNSVRERVNLLFSGGIALAEHMAKSIICGADGVVVDYPLVIALECRLCRICRSDRACPVRLGEIDIDWGRQRLLNLMAAWRNQLLEVMGAMGIREARRLRGEVGRLMRFEDLERESFAPIFGERQV